MKRNRSERLNQISLRVEENETDLVYYTIGTLTAIVIMFGILATVLPAR